MKSIKPKHSAYQSSVVTRLRATFLLLALISCSAAAFSVWQLKSLDRAHARLIESAVPTLRHTHDLQRQLSAVLELAARAENDQSVEQLHALRNQLIKRTESIKDAIQSDKWPEHTAVRRSHIETILNDLQKIHETGVNSQLDMLRVDQSLRAHNERLHRSRENFRGIIEPLLIESAAKLERNNYSLTRQDQAPNDQYRAGLSTQIINQMNLTQISYRFSALIDAAERPPGDELGKSVADWAKHLRFEFKGVMQVLIRLPAGEERQRLAVELSNFQGILFSNAGIASLLKAKMKASADIGRTIDQRLAVIASISRHADRLVETASDDADKAAVDLRDDLTSALSVMAATITMVLLVLAAVWMLVVERQINRRMSRLTDTVSAIADGDIDTPIEVTGHDELSKMGAALEIFKSNATELRRSNEELESFAYAAAHDMRSPLRAIESLALWTLEDAGDDLPGDCRQNLEKLLNRANRLSKLQADLLDYSRIGKDSTKHAPLDLQVHIHNIRELLDPDELFNFVIDVPPQSVEVPETPLRQILINLITNAIKHHDCETGTIHITADFIAEKLAVSVSDDGPGIDPQFHERIFKLFQTLKSRDVVEGSGLGLSFVLKQVNRCGGEIQVMSDPTQGRGTTFVFDLPARVVGTNFKETAPLETETDPA